MTPTPDGFTTQGGVDPQLWASIMGHRSMLLDTYTFDLSPWLGQLNTGAATQHTISVSVAGATGDNWPLSATLLLWRSSELALRSAGPIKLNVSPALEQGAGAGTSMCVGADPSVAAVCTMRLGERVLEVTAPLSSRGRPWLANVRYRLAFYNNFQAFNATNQLWRLSSEHSAGWFLRPASSRKKNNKYEHVDDDDNHAAAAVTHYSKGPGFGGAVTQHAASYEWLHSGGVGDAVPYEFSYNKTQLMPTVLAVPCGSSSLSPSSTGACSGKIRHYQRLIMVTPYTPGGPACTIPDYATHTARIAVTSTSPGRAGKVNDCLSLWSASAAFCSPALLTNELRSTCSNGMSSCP